MELDCFILLIQEVFVSLQFDYSVVHPNFNGHIGQYRQKVMLTTKDIYGGEIIALAEKGGFELCLKESDIPQLFDECDEYIFEHFSMPKNNPSSFKKYPLYCFNIYRATDWLLDARQQGIHPNMEEMVNGVSALVRDEVSRFVSLGDEVSSVDKDFLYNLIISAVVFYRMAMRDEVGIEFFKYEETGGLGNPEWFYKFHARLIPLHPDLLHYFYERNPEPQASATLYVECQQLFWNILNYPTEFPWVNRPLEYFNYVEGVEECHEDFLDNGGWDFGVIINLYNVIGELYERGVKPFIRIADNDNKQVSNPTEYNRAAFQFITKSIDSLSKGYLMRNRRVFQECLIASYMQGYFTFNGNNLVPTIRQWPQNEKGEWVEPSTPSFHQKQTVCFFLARIMGLSSNDDFPTKDISVLFGDSMTWRRTWSVVKSIPFNQLKQPEIAILRKLLPEELQGDIPDTPRKKR